MRTRSVHPGKPCKEVSHPHGDSTRHGKKRTGVPGRNKCPVPRDYRSQRKKKAEKGTVSWYSHRAMIEHFALLVTETKAAEKAIKDG